MYGSAGLMIVSYFVLLAHIALGNKNGWLIMVTIMLLISQIGVILMGYTWFALHTQSSDVLICLQGIGVALYYSLFDLVYFLLAIKYDTISKRVPEKIEGKPRTPDTKCSTALWYI